MKVLGKYHSRDIHEWVDENGEEDDCGFHKLLVCSCGKDKKENESDGAKCREEGCDDESTMEKANEGNATESNKSNGTGDCENEVDVEESVQDKSNGASDCENEIDVEESVQGESGNKTGTEM